MAKNIYKLLMFVSVILFSLSCGGGGGGGSSKQSSSKAAFKASFKPGALYKSQTGDDFLIYELGNNTHTLLSETSITADKLQEIEIAFDSEKDYSYVVFGYDDGGEFDINTALYDDILMFIKSGIKVKNKIHKINS